MLTSNLFEEVLLKPAHAGADELSIVSGYATSAMAFRHLEALTNFNPDIKINLIVGMSPVDGLSSVNHRGFQELMQSLFPGNFSCGYLTSMPPVHSKVYIWLTNHRPTLCFTGSANYTQTAFSQNQREAMTETDPGHGFAYYSHLIGQSIFCNNLDAENIVQIYNENAQSRIRRERNSIAQQGEDEIDNLSTAGLLGLPSVNVSLLDRSGNLPPRSGLNWGQRPEAHREPNQAYIRLPVSISGTNFFPERPTQFTIITDDERVLVCSRAQDFGKAIHTPQNNSLIGEYFRNRLGLANGALVTLADLERYGRTSVTFYKIDDETYFMDFSVPENG